MEEMSKRITLKVTRAFHRAVRLKSVELGIPISKVVRTLLKMWLEGEVVLPGQEREE